MLLKKQTVWLLTMLSLVVVLSVYYVTSDPANNNLATGGQESDETGKNISDEDMKIITDAAGDEVFDMVRMNLEDKRGKMLEDLTIQVASDELTADEKMDIYNQMEEISEISTIEKTLESYIKNLGYSDALVKIENNLVDITVKADEEHSRSAAVEIMELVGAEVGTQYIPQVKFASN
ncbi:SpoIIIAH-like family protein [Lederbergia graminis]|uniref:SpoIIIAH-like family protein n=1 Tax=Lederbergia graminis TaxID=735518 RepID=A0ABW0LDX9_9BACI|nr:SpoIIIAH-like family protein [Paenibacillus bovis]HLU22215.1 SpoIIIAH-like family protein [Bacillaceae bacterium]